MGPVNMNMARHSPNLTMGWGKEGPRLSYKVAPQSGIWSINGAYEFAMLPVVYEIARCMVAGSLSFDILDPENG